jgi:hypothetical protein
MPLVSPKVIFFVAGPSSCPFSIGSFVHDGMIQIAANANANNNVFFIVVSFLDLFLQNYNKNPQKKQPPSPTIGFSWFEKL